MCLCVDSFQFSLCFVAKVTSTAILWIEIYYFVKIHDGTSKLVFLVVSRTAIKIGTSVVRIQCYDSIEVANGLIIIPCGEVF